MYPNSRSLFIWDMEHRRGRSCPDVCLPPYATPALHRLLCQELLAHPEERIQVQHDFSNDSHLSELYRRFSNRGQGVTVTVYARC